MLTCSPLIQAFLKTNLSSTELTPPKPNTLENAIIARKRCRISSSRVSTYISCGSTA